VTSAARLLSEAGAGAPAALQARAAAYVGAASEDPDPARTLARAARTALEAALTHGSDRAGALDLLAADLLVTLALATRAVRNPGRLAEFAAALRANAGVFAAGGR
jgi:hypothetical protein